jgi:hypothetical protein
VVTEAGRHSNTTWFSGAKWLFENVLAYFVKNCEQGAQTTIYCAVSEEAGKETGLYYRLGLGLVAYDRDYIVLQVRLCLVVDDRDLIVLKVGLVLAVNDRDKIVFQVRLVVKVYDTDLIVLQVKLVLDVYERDFILLKVSLVLTIYDRDLNVLEVRLVLVFCISVSIVLQVRCPGAHPASCKMVTGSFPGVKRPGRGADHPPLPLRGQEIVKIYLYSPFRLLVACIV